MTWDCLSSAWRDICETRRTYLLVGVLLMPRLCLFCWRTGESSRVGDGLKEYSGLFSFSSPLNSSSELASPATMVQFSKYCPKLSFAASVFRALMQWPLFIKVPSRLIQMTQALVLDSRLAFDPYWIWGDLPNWLLDGRWGSLGISLISLHERLTSGCDIGVLLILNKIWTDFNWIPGSVYQHCTLQC